jgi:hypothetical protein
MADYPDWVLKHKKKGTYVNCVNGKYYLYAAHSERVPGTKKVRRVSDGYIGRITEADGLIPARDKVSGEVIVYEYGLCMTLLSLCGDISKGLKREFRDAADWVFAAGLLLAAYGCYNTEVYSLSYLSVRYPGLDMSKKPTEKQRTAIGRCGRMASDVMQKRFGPGLEEALERLPGVYMVCVNGRFYKSRVRESTKAWLSDNKIEWGDRYGKGR